MVPSRSPHSCAVGSPSPPGPNSTTSSPAATGSSPQSTTNWAQHPGPALRARPPPGLPQGLADRGPGHAVGVAERDQAEGGGAGGDVAVPVGHSGAGRDPLDLS